MPRSVSIGAAILFILAVMGWAIFAWNASPQLMISSAAVRATTSAMANVMRAQSSPPSLVATTSGPAAAHGSVDNLQVLKNASREELLALAQDMLAKGQSLENIVDLLDYLAAYKPGLALGLARDIGRTDDERHLLLLAAANGWLGQVAKDNPQAALLSAENALTQRSSSIPGASASDVARLALEALENNGHADLAQQAVQNLANGPEAASLDSSVYREVAMSVAQNSPADAATWLESLPNSPARNESVSMVAGVWGQSDPGAAIDWAQALPQADIREDAVTNVFARWLNQDQAGATQWLAAHEDSPDRDRLLSEIVDAPYLANPQS